MRVPALSAFVVVTTLLGVDGQLDSTSLVGVLHNYPELSNLTTFLSLYPDLESHLNALSNITFAAPKNAAWASLLNTSQADAADIETLLEYHIFNGTGLFKESAIIATQFNNKTYTKLPDGAVVKYIRTGDTGIILSGNGSTVELASGQGTVNAPRVG